MQAILAVVLAQVPDNPFGNEKVLAALLMLLVFAVIVVGLITWSIVKTVKAVRHRRRPVGFVLIPWLLVLAVVMGVLAVLAFDEVNDDLRYDHSVNWLAGVIPTVIGSAALGGVVFVTIRAKRRPSSSLVEESEPSRNGHRWDEPTPRASEPMRYSGQDLTGLDLTGENLLGADFSRAVLRGVVLCRANLTGVNLSGADLSGADLTDANLTGVVCDDETIWPEGFDPP